MLRGPVEDNGFEPMTFPQACGTLSQLSESPICLNHSTQWCYP